MEGTAEAAEQEVAVSTQKSLLACHDPGWNDPPKWAFTSGESTPTKRSLNKRVAFPLSSGQNGSRAAVLTSKSDELPAGDFPASAMLFHNASATPPKAVPLLPSCTDETSKVDKEQALMETTGNFEAIISKELESSDKKEQVIKKLDAMKVMWKEDKLKTTIYQKVLAISKALRENDLDGAEKLHLSLMMNDGTLCNTWISGIRHIILELREKSSRTGLPSSNQEDTHPYFLPSCENK